MSIFYCLLPSETFVLVLLCSEKRKLNPSFRTCTIRLDNEVFYEWHDFWSYCRCPFRILPSLLNCSKMSFCSWWLTAGARTATDYPPPIFVSFLLPAVSMYDWFVATSSVRLRPSAWLVPPTLKGLWGGKDWLKETVGKVHQGIGRPSDRRPAANVSKTRSFVILFCRFLFCCCCLAFLISQLFRFLAATALATASTFCILLPGASYSQFPRLFCNFIPSFFSRLNFRLLGNLVGK